MKINDFDIFMDGGTIMITTDEGIYTIDHRLGTTTEGRLYNNMPYDDNSNIIENSDELENRIIEALKFYHNDFYQSSIERLINIKQK